MKARTNSVAELIVILPQVHIFWEENSAAKLNLFCYIYKYKSRFFKGQRDKRLSRDMTVLQAGDL